MDTIEKLDKIDCCGCSACYQRCPKNAITMVENEEGFLYPQIDKDKCINCGLCAKVCPQLSKRFKDNNKNKQKIYALYNKNDNILENSSSGGVFTEISKYILNQNGVVFGAAFVENFKVKHIQIKSIDDINKLRKSKYVQSNTNNVFLEIEKILKSGKKVLFSGTPCQVIGLKNFLGKEYDNLLTCDIVCHGTPSQKSFDQYLKYLSSKMKDSISTYDFRCKDIDGCEKIGKVTTVNGKKKYLKIGLDCYYNNFLEGNIFRESCYNCHYSNMDRVGDITIGDFLGVLQMQPEAYSKKGTSICIINTQKGEELFNNIKDSFKIYESSSTKITKYNSNLNTPKNRPDCRSYIYSNIDDLQKYIKDLKRYMNKKSKIKSLIPIKLKNTIKKLRRN